MSRRAWWRRLWRSLDFQLARLFGAARREDRLFLVLIVATGLVAGFLGVLVHALIDGLEDLLWGVSADTLLERAAGVPTWWVVAAPAIGGLFVGLLLWLFRSVNRAGGMAALIESVALAGGRVPGRAVLTDAVVSLVTVGAGGSLGREGPMIRLGAMLSSRMGTRLGLAPHRVKVLVGCGAAAGLAAVYNIPVGGALFAMEVILGNFALEIFGPVVVSSVISTLIARSFSGDLPRYQATGFALTSGWELFAYIGLGVVGALLSVVFVLTVRSGAQLFRKLTFLPRWLHPLLGFALLGTLAIQLPWVLGGGSETIPLLLEGALPLSVLLVLPLAKIAATAITRGSGGSGGLFTPSLMFGALVGTLYGTGLSMLLPGSVGAPGAYGVVGMAAVSAGTSHAPISAILILFEFTGNYDLILPLMVASITASFTSKWLYPYSIYTESLERRGVELSSRMGEAVLAGLEVDDLIREDPETLAPATRYGDLVERFLATHRQRLYVLDGERRLLGAVSLHDIKGVLAQPEALVMVVAHDLMGPVEPMLRASDRLSHAVEAFSASEYERLPVVDDDGRFRGVLAKRDVLAVYAQEVLGRPAMLATFVSSEGSRAARDYVELPPDFAVRLVAVPPGLVGKTLAEARLPQTTGVRVLELKRDDGVGGQRRVIPEAATRLEAGDEMIVLGPTEAIEKLEAGKAPTMDEAAAIHPID